MIRPTRMNSHQSFHSIRSDFGKKIISLRIIVEQRS